MARAAEIFVIIEVSEGIVWIVVWKLCVPCERFLVEEGPVTAVVAVVVVLTFRRYKFLLMEEVAVVTF